jgi:hypothetical protein
METVLQLNCVLNQAPRDRKEKKYYCFGRVGDGILTVRFTYLKKGIRIIGVFHLAFG